MALRDFTTSNALLLWQVQHPRETTASERDLPGDCAALVVTDDPGFIWLHAEQ